MGMNKLSKERQTKIISALVEGNSLRATARMCHADVHTVMSLLESVGRACAEYHDKAVRNLTSKRIQCDEIWSFCYAKEKNLPEELKGKFGFGDVWTWVALDAQSKLVVSWHVGGRNAYHAQVFMHDVASRLSNRVQLTSDGHRVYLDAVEAAFGNDIDYAMLIKLYSSDRGEGGSALQSGRVHRVPRPEDHWASQPAPYLDKLRRASEPDYANADAPIHAIDERVLQEDRQSHRGDCASLHALQLLPDSSDVARYSCDGGWHLRPCLVGRRNCGLTHALRG